MCFCVTPASLLRKVRTHRCSLLLVLLLLASDSHALGHSDSHALGHSDSHALGHQDVFIFLHVLLGIVEYVFLVLSWSFSLVQDDCL